MTSVRREAMSLSDSRLLLNRLRVAVRSDGASPKSFALLLRRVFEERAWEQEGFDTFGAYVKAPEPFGLDMTEEKLLDAARLANVEPLARSLLYEELPKGRKRGRPTLADKESTTLFNPQRSGNARAETIVTRLKRDDPATAERVVRGEITANAAAREKGWRKPRIVLSSPERVATQLRAHFTDPADRQRLAALLVKESSTDES